MFQHICNFKINASNLNIEEIELELIDFGVDEVYFNDNILQLYAPFDCFGLIQKQLEKRNLEILSSGFERIPNKIKSLKKEAQESVIQLIKKIEEDEDVQNVYHSLKLNN